MVSSPHTKLAPGFALCCALGALAFGGVTPVSAQSQTTTNLTLDDCKLTPDDTARLACYDRVIKAGRADVVSSPAPGYVPASGGGAGAASGAPGLTPEQQRAREQQQFGLPEYTTEASKEKIREITVEIATTSVAAGGKLQFTTSEGATWLQTEGTPARGPAPGTRVEIKTNMMGGRVCKIGNQPVFNCRRTDRPQSNADGIPLQQTSSAPSAPSAPPTPVAQYSPPPVTAQSGATSAPVASTEDLDEITVEVASISMTPDSKVRFTTREGMIWAQTTGSTERQPKVGDTIVISKGTMGGHFCKLNKWESVRCARLDRAPETVQAQASPPPTVAATQSAESAPISGETPRQEQRNTRESFGLPQPAELDDIPDNLEVEVASATLSPSGKLRFVTTDGMIWDQTVGEVTKAPKAGAKVTITKGSMGSRFCKLDKWNSVRCARIE